MHTIEINSGIAVINLDDGKANAVGHDFIAGLNEGLDRALEDAKAVLITGRAGVFSAGFDLKEFDKGRAATNALVNSGANLLLRVFSHPQPVVAACAGHAVAAGALLLLASDARIGADGNFKIGLNETAIGMALPVFGLQLAAARLSKRHQTSATIQGQLFSPGQALDVGYLDDVVDEAELMNAALSCARRLAELPEDAYAANKLGVRDAYIKAIQASLPM